MTSNQAEPAMWSFGYGSNMDVKALEAKKHVKIIEHSPAVLKDHRLAFSLRGIPYVEPAYANIEESAESEIHGVAFKMTKESLEELDRTEAGYNKKNVILEAYDGRKLDGFVYMSKNKPQGEYTPSKRYLGVLLKGGRQAGLKTDYLERLSQTKTYETPKWMLELRKVTRPEKGASLKEISYEEVANHSSKQDTWIAALGYVVDIGSGWAFESHRGRDITTRVLMQFHGIPMDDNDDRGKPPYPLVKDLTPEELEYVTRWLDHYQFKGVTETTKADECNLIVGFIKEFKQQQEEGTTNFALPEPPK